VSSTKPSSAQFVAQTNGNQVKSAGLHRNTLSRTVLEFNIDLTSVRPAGRRLPLRPERQVLRRKKEHLVYSIVLICPFSPESQLPRLM